MTDRVLAGLLVLAITGTAAANGRPASTATITFQPGAPQHVAVGATFGLLRSDDGGVTWRWTCEKAIGYAGTYDPDYAYSPSGALFATTFDGMKVTRDGCTFDSAASGTTFVSQVEVSPRGPVFYAAAAPADVKIYRSIDDGASFPTSGSPGQNNDWWDSLMVAPSDPARVYVTGYRFNKTCNSAAAKAGEACRLDTDCGTNLGAKCEAVKQFLLFRSSDGGAKFTPMSTTGLVTSNNSAIDVVGVDHRHPTELYIRVSLETGKVGDSIYKSSDAGATWHAILSTSDPSGLAFLIRSDGTLVAGTQSSGSVKSANGTACLSQATCNWTPLVGAPHIDCLVEHPVTHEVWACTRNFASAGIPSDGYGIMKSKDLTAWTGVLRYQNIAGVVACDASTIQATQCVASYQGKPSVWCCLEQQLGITDTSVSCTGAADCRLAAGAPSGSQKPAPPAAAPAKGCCNAGDDRGSLAVVVVVAWMLARRKKC